MMRWARLVVAVGILSFSAPLVSAPSGIGLVGKGTVSGSLLDKSGLRGQICQAGNPTNCVPQAVFGGFGSDIAYTGHDSVFVAAPDRGPFDGLTDVPFLDRVHFLHITTDLDAPFPNITTQLVDTRLLKNDFGRTFVGAAGAVDATNEFGTLRLDPEGIRVGPDGTFFISDEYGPYLFEFNRQGHLLRRIAVPQKFAIDSPSGNPTEELLGNSSGRQANRGMEGLAISPDGGTLFGIMQNALLQDFGLAAGTTDRLGVNNRILRVDLATGETQEFVYVVEAINRGQGVSEILAINDHEFLVLERDNRSWLTTGQAPTRKKIYKIDLRGATDVSHVECAPGTECLPAGALPAGVVPVAKSLFIDLLDPAFGLQNNDANAIAEKIEGLAWGPDLSDGRHLLYVVTDNDLNPLIPTQIYAFAVDDANAQLHEQAFAGPLYPPGQIKKVLAR